MAAFEDVTGPDLEQFIGNKWTDWLDATQSEPNNEQETVENTSKRDVEVARLRRPDMTLFGYRPANDRFYLVVCEHCGQLVKPQSMNIHYERNHKSKRIISPPCSKFRPAPTNTRYGADNHRLLPPKPTSMQKPSVSTRHKIESHSVRRSPMNEKSNKFIMKSENASDKASMSSEKDKRVHASNNHRSERPDAKHSSMPHNKLNISSQHVKHHGGSGVKSFSKSGGTIQLQSLPDPQVVSTSLNHSISKQYHRPNKHVSGGKSSDFDNLHNNERKRSDKLSSEISTSNNKAKKLSSSHHSHVRQEHYPNKETKFSESIKMRTPSGEQRFPNNLPLVVLEKTSVSDLNASVTYAPPHNKRPRPIGCDSDPTLSPPRSKVPALHNSGKDLISQHNVPNSSLMKRAKKKEKRILPLKAREYDPNKHCGVRLKEDNSHCTKSLTCKDHPLSAKRAVGGRCKNFDELMKDRGREKQKLKEKAAAEAAARFATPVAENVTTPFIQSAEPPVVTTTTVLSTSTSPQTSQSSVSAGKTKTSTSLFPRIYAAWHIDCWENEEVSDEFSRPCNTCHCVQRHPQPISTPSLFARRIGSCQTSYSRKLERQLMALSTNVQEFGTQLQKNFKAISFTPVGATTYKDSDVKELLPTVPFLHHNNNTHLSSRSSSGSYNQRDRLPSGHSVMQHTSVPQNFQNADIGLFATDNIGAKTLSKNSSRTKVNRKLSNLAPPGGSIDQNAIADVNAISRSKLEQVNNLLRRTASSNSDSGYIVANELSSTSPHFLLGGDFTNDALASPIALSSNSVPKTVNASNAGLPSMNVINRGEKRNHNLARSPKGKSKSAITKYVTTSQGHIDLTRQESIEGAPQLPNGLNSIAGNVLMKHGSVTLSGNIGALTIPGDETAFAGNQITQHMNMNSNNNFLMQNEVLFPSNSPSTKSKQFSVVDCTNSITVPEQISSALSGVTDNSILLNGELLSLNQTNVEGGLRTIDYGQFASGGFSETINLEQSHDPTKDLSENIVQLQYATSDHSDNILQSNKLERRNSTFQLAQIDQSLEQQLNPNSRNRFSLDNLDKLK